MREKKINMREKKGITKNKKVNERRVVMMR